MPERSDLYAEDSVAGMHTPPQDYTSEAQLGVYSGNFEFPDPAALERVTGTAVRGNEDAYRGRFFVAVAEPEASSQSICFIADHRAHEIVTPDSPDDVLAYAVKELNRTAVVEHFDLSKALDAAEAIGPIIELGGPTTWGYAIVDDFASMPEDMEVTNIEASPHGLPPEQVTRIADATALPYRDGSVGAVFVSALRLADEVGPIAPRMYPEVARVLPPGGLFVGQRMLLRDLQGMDFKSLGLHVAMARVDTATSSNTYGDFVAMSVVLQKI